MPGTELVQILYGKQNHLYIQLDLLHVGLRRETPGPSLPRSGSLELLLWCHPDDGIISQLVHCHAFLRSRKSLSPLVIQGLLTVVCSAYGAGRVAALCQCGGS